MSEQRLREWLRSEITRCAEHQRLADMDGSTSLAYSDRARFCEEVVRILESKDPPTDHVREGLVRVRERIARELADIDRQLDALGSPEAE